MGEHGFFISQNIGRLRILGLPISPGLAQILRRLHIETFHDLSGVSVRHFQRISDQASALYLELGRVIERARKGDFAKDASPPSDASSFDSSVAGRRNGRALKPSTTGGMHANGERAEANSPIFIPQEMRGKLLRSFRVSVRLQNILDSAELRLLGELHGITFSKFLKFPNCGKKSLDELRRLVTFVQQTPHPEKSDERQPYGPVIADHLVIPTNARDLKPASLPISVRLQRVLETRKIGQLGDLEGISIGQFAKTKNCGKKTFQELLSVLARIEAGEFSVSDEALKRLNVSELPELVDSLLKQFPARRRDMLLLRFGSTGQAHTLEEIGKKFGVTREFVRQRVEKDIAFLHKAGGAKLRYLLQQTAADCFRLLSPLTPEVVHHWIRARTQSPEFYVRLFCNLNPDIPGWPNGQEPSAFHARGTKLVIRAIEEGLREAKTGLSVGQAYEMVSQRAGQHGLRRNEFLLALYRARSIVVHFRHPEEPVLQLRGLRIIDVAKAILGSKISPVTPEELIVSARATFEPRLIRWSPQTIANALTPGNGFYLLAPRSYGLRQHFRLPESTWRIVRTDVQKLLSQEGRPVSTTEIINEGKFDWAEQTNAYELAQILRDDKRFTDLGKFLFSLTTWGIEEREYVKDLVPRILTEQNRLLTGAQILQHLRKLRSFSPFGLSSILRKLPAVREFGFGYYGLHSWGESVKHNVVTDMALTERVIRRSEPPLRFASLCAILDIPTDGRLAQTLWQTCASLQLIIRQPDQYSPETLLLDARCTLERALVATARAVDRPLSFYEFRWELNARFGPLFTQKSSEEQIQQCLERSRFFVQNADDEFILDIHLDQLGLDECAIRNASLEILSLSNEMVGCDDLMERLEEQGKLWEELSPDILASVLRGDDRLEELSPGRFRVKPCKR